MFDEKTACERCFFHLGTPQTSIWDVAFLNNLTSAITKSLHINQ